MTRALELPKYVLLLTDDAHRQLSYDVAQEMAKIDQTVYIDAFEAPLAEAFRAMWDRDYFKDYTDPRSSAGLLLNSIHQKSEREVIASLGDWFQTEFGTKTLARLARKRALEQQEITEYIYVLHDASLDRAVEFSSQLKSRDYWAFDITKYALDANVTEVILDMEAGWEKLDA